jgi:hypothetical protein
MHQANATKMGRFMWHPISTAPFDGDLELAVIDANGVHALAFATPEAPAVRTLCDLIEGVESVNAACDPTYPELDRK